MQIKSDELTQMILDAYEKGRARGREETLATVPLSPFPLSIEPTIAPFTITSEVGGIARNWCGQTGKPHDPDCVYCPACQP